MEEPGIHHRRRAHAGLGIGATSAVFSLIQGVLLTPPPYQKPQQLMLIQTRAPTEKRWTAREAGHTAVDGMEPEARIVSGNRGL